MVKKKANKTRSFTGRKSRESIGRFIINKRSIIPNAITMSNMTMGFFAIIFASRGDAKSLALAGILVVVGSFFDAIDGAVARAMHVESPVGVQLDSLADGIAYGIAPAIIAYQAYFSHMPQSSFYLDSGMLIAIIFPICAIYRLARFNTGAEEDDHTRFTGLPSPAAGIMISSIPTLEVMEIPIAGSVSIHFPLELFIPIYIATGFLMISRLDYNKLPALIFKKGKLIRITTVILVILFLAIFRMWSVFVAVSLYIIIGFFAAIFKYIRRRFHKSRHRIA
jgi:CDP-diacylglycerol--serine O-phosphatidyltransferase